MLFKPTYLSLIAGLLAISAPSASATLGCHDDCDYSYPRFDDLHGPNSILPSGSNVHQEVLNDIVTTCQMAAGTYTNGGAPFTRCSDWAVDAKAHETYRFTRINWKVSYVGGKAGDQHEFTQDTCVNLYDWELGGCKCGSVQQSVGMQIEWETNYGSCDGGL